MNEKEWRDELKLHYTAYTSMLLEDKECKELYEIIKAKLDKQKVKGVILELDSKNRAGFVNTQLLLNKLGIE